MTLAERLQQLVSALPSDDSAVTITRAGIVALLERDDSETVVHEPRAARRPGRDDGPHLMRPSTDLRQTMTSALTSWNGPTSRTSRTSRTFQISPTCPTSGGAATPRRPRRDPPPRARG